MERYEQLSKDELLEIIYRIKEMDLYTAELDYDYEEESFLNYEPFDIDEFIEEENNV